jgi:hypothetical protein
MDSAPFRALVRVQEFRRDQGEEKIRARQNNFRDQAGAAAESFGWERVSPRDPALLGPLLAFRAPEKWGRGSTVDLATRIFRECQVQLALPVVSGETLVRFSPGAYATAEEVAAGMARLGAWQA